MKCREAQEWLSSWCDDELTDAERQAVDAHLEVCGDCRRMSQEVAVIGDRLRDGLQTTTDERSRILTRLSESMVDPEPTESRLEAGRKPIEQTTSLPPARQKHRDRWQWSASLLLAAAAGFLMAWWLFRDSVPNQFDDRRIAETEGSGGDTAQGDNKLLATVNVSLGEIETRTAQKAEWKELTPMGTFLCPTDSEIRTKKGAACEVQLADGSILRMDESTRVKFVADDMIEVHSGQLWCQAGLNNTLKICSTAPTGFTPNGGDVSTTSWTAQCTGETCMVTTVKSEVVNVFASKGQIDFQSDLRTTSLKRGQVVRIVDGKIMPSSGPFDAIAATRWIHAILREKNLGDPELNERIRDLLLAAGYTKVVFHGDDEIRSLGEQAVLPLLAYLKSPQFQNQKPQRRRAASLTSDLAPMWAIGDLIGMLSDDDAEVAAICSRALVRLAGTNLGEPVEQWQDDLERRLAVQQRWREWWQLREAKMPKHPLRGVNNQAVEIQGLKNQGVKQ